MIKDENGVGVEELHVHHHNVEALLEDLLVVAASASTIDDGGKAHGVTSLTVGVLAAHTITLHTGVARDKLVFGMLKHDHVIAPLMVGYALLAFVGVFFVVFWFATALIPPVRVVIDRVELDQLSGVKQSKITWLEEIQAPKNLVSNVNALKDVKLEKVSNLREESSFFWREINDGTLRFDRTDMRDSLRGYVLRRTRTTPE
ncbi:hypothetical protein JHK82_052915 [Glycine max]|nr:hypothetical protein JHK82_052915 [Glycine max]